MASTALRRPVGHEDRLSLVEHLDELRSRLIISLIILIVSFSVCFAFNGTLLDIVNKPLEHTTQKNVDRGRGPLGQTKKVGDAVRGVGQSVDGTLAILSRPDSGLPKATRAALGARDPRRSCPAGPRAGGGRRGRRCPAGVPPSPPSSSSCRTSRATS